MSIVGAGLHSPGIAEFAEVVTRFQVDPQAAGAMLPQGRPVVGYFDAEFPVELIMAAGALPIQLRGDPHRSPDLALAYLDAGVSPRIAHAADAVVHGRFPFVDLLCVRGGDQWYAGMEGFLNGMRGIDGSHDFAPTYYLDRARAKFREHRDFNRDRLREFRAFLEEFFGVLVTDDGIRDVIAVTNQTRLLMRRLAELRAESVPRLSGVEGAIIACAATLMDRVAFNQQLSTVLESLPAEQEVGPDRRPRVFVSGSSLDHVELHSLIESCGAMVVGEDTELGAIRSMTDIAIDGDPIEALADYYTYCSVDPWLIDMKSRIETRVKFAVSTDPGAVVFYQLRGDNGVGWDYPDQRSQLEEAGIAVRAWSDQEYAVSNDDDLRAEMQSLVRAAGDSRG